MNHEEAVRTGRVYKTVHPSTAEKIFQEIQVKAAPGDFQTKMQKKEEWKIC